MADDWHKRFLSEELPPVLLGDVISSGKCFVNLDQRLNIVLISLGELLAAGTEAVGRTQKLQAVSSILGKYTTLCDIHVEDGCEG